ncbi:MAG: PRC-barrel domain-containing protein [Rhizobiales bacterium]|nr:PRC-barrel domain-containing protein [Hyphomicrobiales bacterium]
MEAMERPVNSLIGADKVEGTAVYDPTGERLGAVHDVMIDKVSGRVAYAVLSFGGFLGIGENYHPLPWNALKYDTELGGYVVGLSREQLEGGPTYDEGEEPAWGDRAYEKRVHDYYGVPPYWMV